jgi:hypothetical protein
LLFPSIIPVVRQSIILPTTINANWLSGFVAGDGSFMVNIRKCATSRTGYQVQAGFNIGQHTRDIN